MSLVRRMFTLSLCLILVNSSINNSNNENLGENYNEEVSAFVSHLNSSPVKVYKYRDPSLQSAQKKADIIELVVDVSVDCIDRTAYPDLPCESTSLLTCTGFVQRPSSGQQAKVLGDIKCTPRQVNTPKSLPDIEITPPQNDNQQPRPDFSKQSVALSNEAASSESGERFVAVRRDSVPCLGCPFDLAVDAQGVDELTDLGLRHVESERTQKQLLVKVLRLQQQVVAGIKYVLLVEIASSLCPKEGAIGECAPDVSKENAVCEITFIQKPWIDKTKHVIGNNCTVSQEFAVPSKTGNEIDNEIVVGNPKPGKPAFSSDNFDEIAQSGKIDDDVIMSPSRLSDLESQILVDPPTSPAIEDVVTIVETVEAFEAKNDNRSPPVIESVEVFTTVPEELTVAMQSDQPTGNVTEDGASSSTTSETVTQATETSETVTKATQTSGTVSKVTETSQESSESDSNSSSSEEQVKSEPKRLKRAIRQLVKISPEEKPFIKDLSDLAANALDNIDDDNHRRVVLQILGAKRTVGGYDGTTYSLILRMGISKCLENRPIDSEFDCREKLFEHYTKICKVQVHVDEDNSNPKLVKSQCQNIKRDKDDSNKNRTNYSRYRRHTPGGPVAVDKNSTEVLGLVTDALVYLDGKTSHDNKLKVHEIKSASRQVVSGTVWKLKVAVVLSDCKKSDPKESKECGKLESSSPKDCDVLVWIQPWLPNGKQTNITCSGEGVTHSFRSKRSTDHVLGGQTEAAKDDPRVLEYLNGGLAHLDSQSSHENKWTFVEVMTATKQVVSGSLYRITAKIALSNCRKNENKDPKECGLLQGSPSKVCDFKIWDQPWLPNGRQTNITCENEEVHSFRAKRSTDHVLGGQTEAAKDDPRVLEYLNGGLAHLDSQSSHENKWTLVEVMTATKQVVSGSLYRITAKIALSNCRKNENKDPKECGLLQGSPSKVCDFKIWDQPWLPNGRQTNITCENEEVHSFRAKRSTEEEFESKKIHSIISGYLRSGLVELDSKSSDKTKLTIVKVLSMKKNVDGALFKIRAELALSDCDKNDKKRNVVCKQLEGAPVRVCNFTISERPWLNGGKLTNVKCEKGEENSNRGGVDSSLDKYRNGSMVPEYLRGGLGNLDSESKDDKKLTVVKVRSVTTEMVAGAMYTIKADVALSECDKNGVRDFMDCGPLPGAPSKTCKFVIWDRPWLPNGRQTSALCDDDEEVARSLESKDLRNEIVGGRIEGDKNDPMVMKYLRSGLNHLDSKSSDGNKLTLVDISSVKTRVVAGVLYTIEAKIALSECDKNGVKDFLECKHLPGASNRSCHFEVWDRPWLHDGRETNITCKNEKTAYFFKTDKSSEVETGAEVEVHRNDPKVLEYLRNSLIVMDSKTTDDNKLTVVRIVSVSKRIDVGVQYQIEAEIALSRCGKNDSRDFLSCKPAEDTPSRICNFTIWDRPYLSNGIMTNIKCEEEVKNAPVEIVGGKIEGDKKDPMVLEYLRGGLGHLDSKGNDDKKLTVVKVLSVTTRIASGVIYNIKAEVVRSECDKTGSKDFVQCAPLQGGSSRICDFEIWDQPWLPKGRETIIKCENEKDSHTFRAKRSVNDIFVGGQVERKKDDPLVMEYLRGGIGHLDSKSSNDKKLTLVDVLSVNVQVVSGTMYRIKAEIALSECDKNDGKDLAKCSKLESASSRICDFEIWDQPWRRNGRETTITCENDKTTYSFRSGSSDVSNQLGVEENVKTRRHFKSFMSKFDKSYDNAEEFAYRLKVFGDNLKYIAFLNKNEQGTAQYGLTEFADRTREEFSSGLGLREDLRNENEVPLPDAEIPDIDLPTEFDWRNKGVVSEVKNQGQCGSCWAFSVTGNIEGQYAIKHGELLEFSEQELVDCDKSDDGCNGGLMDNAWRSIEKLGGLETEKDYPYDAEDETCHFNKSLAKVQLTGAVNVSQDETDMAKWLVKNGPISIAINANAMQFYVGGVSHPYKFLCNPTNLDHGVLIVGFGVHKYPLFNKSLPYWIVKNSWGPSWGEQGYYRVYRGDGTCGVNQTPASAIVA